MLYVEDPPRYEYRFLQRVLVGDPTLRTQVFLSSADPGYQHAASSGADPLTATTVVDLLCDAKALASVDVLIWGDLHPDRLTRDREKQAAMATSLKSFVDSGKGLLFIGGLGYVREGNPGAGLEALLPATPKKPDLAKKDPAIESLVADLASEAIETRDAACEKLRKLGHEALPYLREAADSKDIEVRGRARELLTLIPYQPEREPSKIRLTAAGRDHAATRPSDKDLWSRAPEMRWWVTELKLRDGASALVETHTSEPILVVEKRGKGRVALLATDDWWLWRNPKGDEDYYKATYRPLLAWLAGK